MCGILGWIGADSVTPEGVEYSSRALKALNNRGPDGAQLEAGEDWVLGHTRLAIIDLSERAKQPMSDGLGAWLVYNGEIYNFRELRKELSAEGFQFRSSSDTEVLLYALRRWGPACLERLRGMFAFGWLDTAHRQLILARDRYGVKPLAYQLRGDSFRFASDLFALRALPGGKPDVDAGSAYLYMGLGYVPAPHSILTGIRKVRPGYYLRVSWGHGAFDIDEHQYWSMSQVPGAADGASDNKQDVIEECEGLLRETVRYRLISDVPVGSLLSGGIDSSLVTAVCREQEAVNVPSFTMGFEDPEVDEAPFARRLAEYIGGQHTEFRIGEEDVLKIWKRLWNAYDEPFADSSALPMLALCQLVAAHVKVGLCGDGGDETFCGYPSHRAINRLSGLSAIPAFVRRPLAAMTASLAPRLRYKAAAFGQADRVGQWSALRTGLSDTTSRLLPVQGAAAQAPFREHFGQWSRDLESATDPLDWACRMDLVTYLPDDLMVKADRASMNVGLELRAPLLDHQLTSWSLRLPIGFRYDRATDTTKILLRAMLERRLPKILYERPKQGFTPPLHRWLKGPLLPDLTRTLKRLEEGDLAPLQLPSDCRSWAECAARLNDRYQQFLWRIVCFSEWLNHYRSTPAPEAN